MEVQEASAQEQGFSPRAGSMVAVALAAGADRIARVQRASVLSQVWARTPTA